MRVLQQKRNGGVEASYGGAVVRRFPFVGDDDAFLRSLKAGHQGAFEMLYDRYAKHIERVLVRILGFDSEIGDLLQEVFVQALGSIHSLRDSQRLQAWLTSIAVFTAKGCIRRRTRKRWLMFQPAENLPETLATQIDDDSRETLDITYQILGSMSAEERIAFSLRFIEGMELAEVADACDVSLATIKRKLARAEKKFLALAQRHPPVVGWIKRGERWRDR